MNKCILHIKATVKKYIIRDQEHSVCTCQVMATISTCIARIDEHSLCIL